MTQFVSEGKKITLTAHPDREKHRHLGDPVGSGLLMRGSS